MLSVTIVSHLSPSFLVVVAVALLHILGVHLGPVGLLQPEKLTRYYKVSELV
jgi:hypothetical protein